MARVTLVDPSSHRPQLEDLSTLFPRASAILGAARSRPQARHDGELARVAPDTDSDLLLETMDRDGGLVIEGLLTPAIVDRIDAELTPAVEARGPGFRPGFDDSFYGSNTVRVQGIAAKSRTFVDEYLLHPTLLDIADRVLLPYCGDYWMSQSETIYIGPGNERQALHRDDLNWNLAAQLRVPLQISVLVALGDYDAEVGATHVIPQSHRWPLERPIDPSLSQQVELAPGDALVYLGSMVHGGGANVTTGRWRKALYLSYLVGWLTPEEAVPLGVGADVAATLPPRARQLLGFAGLPERATDDPAEAALALWQLDADAPQVVDGTFRNR
jgi:ectoine hydroxylase-related dioxygenase (phytanoyl-CoA dioxygenase family)